MYLIFTTKEDADFRADEEGKELNLSFWKHGSGSKRVTSPRETTSGEWALDVSEYELDEGEASSLVDTVQFPQSELE